MARAHPLDKSSITKGTRLLRPIRGWKIRQRLYRVNARPPSFSKLPLPSSRKSRSRLIRNRARLCFFPLGMFSRGRSPLLNGFVFFLLRICFSHWWIEITRDLKTRGETWDIFEVLLEISRIFEAMGEIYFRVNWKFVRIVFGEFWDTCFNLGMYKYLKLKLEFKWDF